MDGAIPRQVVLGWIKKEAQEAMGSKERSALASGSASASSSCLDVMTDYKLEDEPHPQF